MMNDEQTDAASTAPRNPNLVLIGFMGVGKSRIGPMCARRLGYEFRDSDHVIEARVGCPIPEFFAREGEAAFRELERQTIAELANRRETVIATGGGTVLNPENAARMRESGVVVWLTAPPRQILQRVGDTSKRPLLADCANPLKRIQTLLTQRTPCYEQAAHHSVCTVRRTPGSIVREILALYEEGIQVFRYSGI